MGLNQVHYLIVPGWHGSEDEHWQSHWERTLPLARRVRQKDWVNPDLNDWVEALDQHIGQTPDQVILVAHSLGCITIAHWAQRASAVQLAKVAGALLVAPADVERPNCPEALRGFAPIPMQSLPFPSVLVGSSNDTAATAERAYALGRAWGSSVTILANAGHINVKSGHGAWQAGFRFLYQLQKLIERRSRTLQPLQHSLDSWITPGPALNTFGFAVSY